jgi:hypothetical protein
LNSTAVIDIPFPSSFQDGATVADYAPETPEQHV